MPETEKTVSVVPARYYMLAGRALAGSVLKIVTLAAKAKVISAFLMEASPGIDTLAPFWVESAHKRVRSFSGLSQGVRFANLDGTRTWRTLGYVPLGG